MNIQWMLTVFEVRHPGMSLFRTTREEQMMNGRNGGHARDMRTAHLSSLIICNGRLAVTKLYRMEMGLRLRLRRRAAS